MPRLERVSSLLWPGGDAPEAPFLSKDQKLVLEIGCGMGGFILQMAARCPEDRFLAVERDKNVAVRAMENALASGFQNIRFCLCDAGELSRHLPEGRVSGIFLNFSDPWPHRKHEHRRLTHRGYLRLYRALLSPDGSLTLKTDNRQLFLFTEAELLSEGWTLLAREEDLPDSEDNIRTEYEARFRAEARPVYRISAQAPRSEEAR